MKPLSPSDPSTPPLEYFSRLVSDHQAGVRAFVRSLLAAPEDADDLAQEAFLVAFRRWKEFDASRDFGAWVRGIAFRLLLNERRKVARRVENRLRALGDVLIETVPDPEECSPRDEDLLNAVHGCMDRLDDSKRRLLRDRYETEVSLGELAARLEISEEGVRKSLQRLRLLVRHCVEQRLKESWS